MRGGWGSVYKGSAGGEAETIKSSRPLRIEVDSGCLPREWGIDFKLSVRVDDALLEYHEEEGALNLGPHHDEMGKHHRRSCVFFNHEHRQLPKVA